MEKSIVMDMFKFDESFVADRGVSHGQDHITTVDDRGRITTEWRRRINSW